MAKHAGQRKHHEQLTRLNELMNEDEQDVRIQVPHTQREVESLDPLPGRHGIEVVRGARRKASADRRARRASIESKLAGTRTFKDIERAERIARYRVINSILMLTVSLIALGAWSWVLTNYPIVHTEWWAWAFWAASALCVVAFTFDAHISIMRRNER